jgi:hypothetical protein
MTKREYNSQPEMLEGVPFSSVIKNDVAGASKGFSRRDTLFCSGHISEAITIHLQRMESFIQR